MVSTAASGLGIRCILSSPFFVARYADDLFFHQSVVGNLSVCREIALLAFIYRSKYVGRFNFFSYLYAVVQRTLALVRFRPYGTVFFGGCAVAGPDREFWYSVVIGQVPIVAFLVRPTTNVAVSGCRQDDRVAVGCGSEGV